MTKKTRHLSMTVWIVKEWYVWPFAWILAGRNYVRSIDELIAKVLSPAVAQGKSFDKLHILSHGNRYHDPLGKIAGYYIGMGGTDRLDTADFDEHCNLIPRTNTEKFLVKLRHAMNPEGRLIFSACGQGDGTLLFSISRYIDNRITVSGYSKLGHPFGRGNIAFRNGFRVKP